MTAKGKQWQVTGDAKFKRYQHTDVRRRRTRARLRRARRLIRRTMISDDQEEVEAAVNSGFPPSAPDRHSVRDIEQSAVFAVLEGKGDGNCRIEI